MSLAACDDPPGPGVITPPPSEFDPIVATTAVGTIPGDASVTPDGTFTYAMPIEVPPGRAGMQPSLGITYASGEVETALGVGFSLSGLSAITRCPRTIAQDGERRDVELTADDRLCLDGQRLVTEAGAYGAADARYRTEEDELLSILPLDESVSLGGFRVRMPDGHVRTYGDTSDGRVTVRTLDGLGDVVETWLLTREEDAQGNTIDYTYAIETPPAPMFGSGVTNVRSEVRISRIDYTGRVGGDGLVSRGTRSVRFVYRDRPRTPPVGSCDDFPSDPGVSTSALCAASPAQWAFARGSAAIRASSRPLERVETYVADDLASVYRLRGSDAPGSHLYRLDEIDHCVSAPAASESDADPDEPGLVCMPPTRFTWRDRVVVVRPNGIRDGETDPRYGLPTFQRHDLFWPRAELLNSFRCGNDAINGQPRWCTYHNPIAAMDANGDGADDVAFRGGEASHYGVVVALGRPSPRGAVASLTGTGLDRPFGRTFAPRIRSEVDFLDADLAARRVMDVTTIPVVDWNTDGLDDLLVRLDLDGMARLFVLVSEPCTPEDPCTDVQPIRFVVRDTGFAEPATIAEIDPTVQFNLAGFPEVIHRYSREGVDRFTLADVDGDGRQDVLACVTDPDCELTRFGVMPTEPAFEACPGHWAVSLRGEAGFRALVHSDVRTECGFEFGETVVQHSDLGNDDSRPRTTMVEAGDFDGDGRQELVIAPDYFRPRVVRPDGSVGMPPRRVLHWDGSTLAATEHGNIPSYGILTAVDVNGDGIHDLFGDLHVDVPDDEDIELPRSLLALGTGTGFVSDLVSMPMPDRRRTRLVFVGESGRPYVRTIIPALPFDMNRDGRGDLVVPTLDADETVVRRVPGTPDNAPQYTWGDEGVWIAEILSPGPVPFYTYPSNAELGRTEYLESRGSHLSNPTVITHDHLVLDGDGDGNLDLIDVPRRFPDSALAPAAPVRFFHNVRAEAPLVVGIEDGMGAHTLVRYTNLSDPGVYTRGTGCSYPERCVTDAREVVHELQRDDGLGEFRTTRYRYEDGRMNLTGRGWLGFRRVTSVDVRSGATTVTTYDNTSDTRDVGTGGRVRYPFAHRPTEIVSYTHDPSVSGSVRLQGSRTLIGYRRFVPGLGRYRVRVDETCVDAFESLRSPPNPGAPWEGAAPIRRTRTTAAGFDDHGFPATVTTETDDVLTTLGYEGSTSVVRTTWEHDLDLWRLGFVAARATTSTTATATGAVDACDREVFVRNVNDLAAARVVTSFRNPGSADTEQEVHFGYDAFGNVTEITTRARDEAGEPETRVETVTWDVEGYFPIEVVNAVGHVSTTAYEPRYGRLRAMRDPNWVEARSYFDGFGRPRISETDRGERTEAIYQREVDGRFRVDAITAGGGRVSVETDRLGRMVRQELTHAFRTVEVVATYDDRGRVSTVSEPRDLGTTGGATTRFFYDGLDRLRQVLNAEDERTDYRYPVNAVERSNSAGHRWLDVHDGHGHVVRSVEPTEGGAFPGGVTTYGRCGGGEVYRIRDAAGHVTRIDYDSLGRRTSLVDPDTGLSAFVYDGWDELTETLDAEDRVTRFVRDALGRLVERHDDADGMVASWEYDSAPLGERMALGLLSRSLSGDGIVDEYAYDVLARPVSASRTFADLDGTLVTTQSYDELSRVSEMVYPSLLGEGVRVAYEYEETSGELVRVSDAPGELSAAYWELTAQDVHGLPARELVGVASRVTGYTASGRVRQLTTRAAGTDLQRLVYQHDARGLLRGRNDLLARRNEVFAHDALGRLYALRERGRTIESYDYGLTGNLLATHDGTLTYPAGTSAPRPHGVTDFEGAGGEVWSASYDGVGNVTDLGELHLTWNQRNLPRSALAGDVYATFEYDADGARAVKVAGPEITAYFGAYEVRRVGAGTLERTVIATPAGPVAQVEVSSDGETTARQTRWLFTERQGSVETSWLEGEAPEHIRYDGFGGVLDPAGMVSGEAPSGSVSHGYTGHEHDGELGLVNMNGRIYHPRLRRFLSADPLTTGRSQGLNRYSYVQNSPHNLIDPTGFQADGDWRRAVERWAQNVATTASGCDATGACVSVTVEVEGVEGAGTVEPWGGGDPSDADGEPVVGGGPDSGAVAALLAQTEALFGRRVANYAGFLGGFLLGFGGAVVAGAAAGALAATIGAPAVVGLVTGAAVYALMFHGDEIYDSIARPWGMVWRGEGTPMTYFEAGVPAGAVVGAPVGAAVEGIVAEAMVGTTTSVAESILSGAVSGGAPDVVAGIASGGSGEVPAAAGGVVNEVPSTLARVIPGEGPFPTLGPPGRTDVFVTAADDIAGLSPVQIAERLTIPRSSSFTVIEFPTPAQGLASPVLRTDPGFVGRGFTAGGAREFVLPNGPVPAGAATRVVR